MSRLIVFAITFLLAGLTAAARADRNLTYPDLVGRMTDLARLAVLPDRGEKCAQWSSYDRASQYDEKTGKYVHWDANGDGSGIIRSEGDQVGDGRDERAGLHLADLVGRARQGTREDLPRRPGRSRPSTCRSPTISTASTPRSPTRRFPTTWPTSVAAARTSICRSPIRSRARSWPTRAGATTSTSTTRPIRPGPTVPTFSAAAGRPARRPSCKAANDFFANELGTDPAGKRPGQETLAQSGPRRAGPDGPGGPARRPAGDHRPVGQGQVRQSRRRDDRPCGSWPCGSPGTASRSRPSGARWAISSAPPRA